MSAWVRPDGGIPSSATASAGGLLRLPEIGVVFCDWLDVTFNPAEDLSWLRPLLTSLGASEVETGKYSFSEGGVIKHQIGRRWQRLSISGTSLAVFRSYGLFSELLRCISQHPYKVTRLDAALDFAVDAAPIVSRLWAVYQSSELRLNLWNTLASHSYFGTRFDGAITGTFYAGNRRVNKITARVYDKQHEVYERTKQDIGFRIRYELTVKTDQVNLRDVDEPAAVFWHYMSPALLQPDSDVPVWVSGNPYVWGMPKIPPLSAEDRLYRVVYGTGDLNAAMAICGDSVGMFEYLLKLVRLRILGRASSLSGWSAGYE